MAEIAPGKEYRSDRPLPQSAEISSEESAASCFENKEGPANVDLFPASGVVTSVPTLVNRQRPTGRWKFLYPKWNSCARNEA